MNTEVREAVVVDVLRTTFGKRGGALAHWHPTDLLGFAISALLDRTGVDPGRIDDVLGGCVAQVGEQSTNVTRNAWVAAGLPQHVPATTIDRQCGSSQQAIHFGAAGVVAGHYDMVVACGVETMSRVPMASNARGGTGPFSPAFLEQIDGRLWAQFRVAQVLADRYDITRQDMDAYALESHRRAAAARRWLSRRRTARSPAKSSPSTRASAGPAPWSRWVRWPRRSRGRSRPPPTSPPGTPLR
jgi:acetyl-CoA acyltransferase